MWVKENGRAYREDHRERGVVECIEAIHRIESNGSKRLAKASIGDIEIKVYRYGIASKGFRVYCAGCRVPTQFVPNSVFRMFYDRRDSLMLETQQKTNELFRKHGVDID